MVMLAGLRAKLPADFKRMVRQRVEAVANHFKRYPWYFRAYRFRQCRKYQVNPALTPHKELLDTLLEDGLAVLPGYYSPDKAAAIRAAVEPPLEDIRCGTYRGPGPFFREARYGVYRLMNADRLNPAVRDFFEDPFILSLARAYTSCRAVSYQRMAELRPDIGHVSSADINHIDDWRIRFKAFLYLTDVGPEQAPFVYLRKSQRPASWRFPKEFEYFRDGHKGSFGSIPDEELAVIQEKHHYEEVVCVGQAGTLILTDTRGIHRGTPLVQGKRILLANYFDVRD